jgi:tape measure domain-containing protein
MAAPELRLAIGLDLEFFRGQMRKAVNIAQSEFTAQLNVKINRRVLDSELNQVSRMFARRDFRLQVNDTSIKAARLNAQKLKNTLDTIAKTKYVINVQGAPAGGFAQGPTGAAGLFEYMRTQGLSGGGGATAVGRTARIQRALEDLSVKQLQALAKQEGIAGVSRLRKTPLIEKMMTGLSQLAMERILGNAQMMLQSPFPYVATTGVSGRTLGARVSGQMPMGGAAPMLPAAGQTAAFSMGTMPSNLRQPSMPSVGMMGPSSQLGPGYFAGGRLAASLRELDPMLRQARVPLAGAIEELGGQFAQATKQVLLYGTAYKALAFFLDLPRQAFEATKAVQLFENQIRAITGSAEEADRAFGFVDNLSERFALPLQSARQGFAQLYASMSPAGIPAGDIETLFEGMANAAATFGFSSAEMDRMTLAFSQMASKGKIMTEEVTRQLGDVLPGALALMARAAQMEIADFIDAMQKGQFAGEAMKAVMFNIGIIMQQEFGEGAKNAAVLLRGAMNEMSNAVLRMYEAFRPLVEALAAEAIPMITEAVKSATAGIRVFVADITDSKRPVGDLNGIASTVAQTLQSLAEIFKALTTIVKGLGPTFGLLGQAILSILEQVARFINTPVGGFLTNFAAKVLLLTAAFQSLVRLGLISAIANIVRMVTNLQLLTRWMGITGVAARTLRVALTGLVAGSVLLGIELLVSQLGKAAQRMEDLRNKTIATTQAIRSMSSTEALAKERSLEGNLRVVEGILARREQQIETAKKRLPAGASFRPSATIEVTAQEQAVLEELGLARQGLRGRIFDVGQVTGVAETTRGMIGEARTRQQAIRFEEQREAEALREINLQAAEGDGKTGRALGEYDASQLDFIKQRTEQEKLALERRRQSSLISETQYKLSIAELDLETAKAEESERLRLARLSIARENLSEQDKLNKLKDAEIYKENALTIARDKHLVATEGIIKELAGPLDQALADNNLQVLEQNMLLDQILNGRQELSVVEQAALEVMKLTKNLSEDEKDLLKDRIALLEQSAIQRLENVKATERELDLLRLGNQLQLARTLDPRLELRKRLEQEGLAGEDLEKRFNLETQLRQAEKIKEQITGIASSIGDAFGEAFKGIVLGTSSVREALAGMFQSIADSFADMVAQMIAEWLRAQLIRGFMSLFPGFGGAGLGSSESNLAQYAPLQPFANGGIAAGGFQAFANGGIVTGPTLGLVGEGRYNEAVIPLPDGRSVPVELSGGGSSSPTVIVNVDAKGSQVEGNEQNANQLGRVISAAVQTELIKQQRPGGLLAR